jgi:hypothetical protein
MKMPRILCEIVREAVSAERDLAVRDALEGDAALETISGGEACVVITQLDDPAPESLARLFGSPSRVRVIALSADGRTGTVYDLRLQQRPLGTRELSRAELLAAIREPLGVPVDRRREDHG